MSDGMGREFTYLSSHATNRYFIPNWGKFIKNECNDKRKHIKSAWQTRTKLYNNSEALTRKRSRLR